MPSPATLQRYRIDCPRVFHVLTASSFLIDYPIANRLFAASLEVLDRCKQWCLAILFSAGGAVFQPLKVECSGFAR